MLPTGPYPGTTRYAGHKGAVYALCADGGNGGFFSAGGDGLVVHWAPDNGSTGVAFAKVGRAIFALHHTPRLPLFIGDEDGGLHVVDLGSRSEVQLEQAHRKGIFGLVQLPEGRLAAAGGDGVLSVWTTQGPDGRISLQRKIPLSDEKVRGLALSPDSRVLAAACGDGRIHLLNSASLNELFTLEGHATGANCLAWHPHKPVLVSGGKDGHLRLWRSDRGFAPLHAFPAHKDTIYAVAFSTDGTLLASASRDKSAKLWDANRFAPLRRLDRRAGGHGYSVNALLWTEQDTLLTASDDKSVIAWPTGSAPFRTGTASADR